MELADRLGIGHQQLADVIEGGPLDAPLAGAKLHKMDHGDYAPEFRLGQRPGGTRRAGQAAFSPAPRGRNQSAGGVSDHRRGQHRHDSPMFAYPRTPVYRGVFASTATLGRLVLEWKNTVCNCGFSKAWTRSTAPSREAAGRRA
jgi:hypothetical protein